MKHYKVAFSDGSEKDIFADYGDVRRVEVSKTRTEYGQLQSFLLVLEFFRQNQSDFNIPIATFNFEKIAGFYEQSKPKELQGSETCERDRKTAG